MRQTVIKLALAMMLPGHLLAAQAAGSKNEAAESIHQVPDSIKRVRATLDDLRAIYLLAVQKESAIPKGLRTIEQKRASGTVTPGGAQDGLLSAYRGALITLRAKHGFWPPARLRHLRSGLAVLDRAVRAHPEQTEIRYLRLMSCYYLPAILGREGSVKEDFAELARLLPAAQDAYPLDVYSAMVRFLLEHGDLEAHQRSPLRQALAETIDG